MYRLLTLLVCSVVLLTATGCSALLPNFYQVDVRQGNRFDEAALSQLQPGMTKSQVQALMGTPLLNDPFHSNRWDYVYRLQSGNNLVEQRRVSLFFEGELLKHIENKAEPQS